MAAVLSASTLAAIPWASLLVDQGDEKLWSRSVGASCTAGSFSEDLVIDIESGRVAYVVNLAEFFAL